MPSASERIICGWAESSDPGSDSTTTAQSVTGLSLESASLSTSSSGNIFPGRVDCPAPRRIESVVPTWQAPGKQHDKEAEQHSLNHLISNFMPCLLRFCDATSPPAESR